MTGFPCTFIWRDPPTVYRFLSYNTTEPSDGHVRAFRHRGPMQTEEYNNLSHVHSSVRERDFRARSSSDWSIFLTETYDW